MVDQFATAPLRGRRALYARLRGQIADGSWQPGTRLPSTRALAAASGLARTTVVAVYEQLASEGYIETSPGARARVAAGMASPRAAPAGRGAAGDRAAAAPSSSPAPRPPPSPASPPRLSRFGQRAAALALPQPPSPPQQPPPLPLPDIGPDRGQIDFLYGALAPQDFPTLAWRRAYNRALLEKPAHSYYGPPEGEAALRTALQGYLQRARGIACRAEQIVIVQGSQQAIDLCARLLVDPGDAVVIEEPGYLMARRVFEAAGAALHPVPVDAQGLDPRQLPEPPAGVRLAYVTPSHQFPLGGVMPVARRQALLAWARRQGAWIVEDDYDGEFRYGGLKPVDSLQSLDDSGSVLYVGTFSKALSPLLRLGYLVLPPALVAPFRQAKQLGDRQAPRLEQRVLAELIASGVYERHVRRQRRGHERRRSALIAGIARHLPADARVDGAASGLHLVVWLPGVPVHDEPRLVAEARAAGVGVWPISPLYAEGRQGRPGQAGRQGQPADCAGLVLGYACLDEAAIEAGLQRLGRVVRRLGRSPAT